MEEDPYQEDGNKVKVEDSKEGRQKEKEEGGEKEEVKGGGSNDSEDDKRSRRMSVESEESEESESEESEDEVLDVVEGLGPVEGIGFARKESTRLILLDIVGQDMLKLYCRDCNQMKINIERVCPACGAK